MKETFLTTFSFKFRDDVFKKRVFVYIHAHTSD